MGLRCRRGGTRWSSRGRRVVELAVILPISKAHVQVVRFSRRSLASAQGGVALRCARVLGGGAAWKHNKNSIPEVIRQSE